MATHGSEILNFMFLIKYLAVIVAVVILTHVIVTSCPQVWKDREAGQYPAIIVAIVNLTHKNHNLSTAVAEV